MSDSGSSNYYRSDLAWVHHHGFGFHADACAPGILRLLKLLLQRHGLVVEVGCGSGLLARHLVDAGHRVIATDASPAMIDLARHHVPDADDARVRHGNRLQEPGRPAVNLARVRLAPARADALGTLSATPAGASGSKEGGFTEQRDATLQLVIERDAESLLIAHARAMLAGPQDTAPQGARPYPKREPG